VLFLKSNGTAGDSLPDVFGLNQGVFRVRVDPRTGQKMVVPPPVMATAPADGEPQAVKRGAVDRRPLAFEAFGARVRDVMASTRKGKR
jgi:hypothetical protein